MKKFFNRASSLALSVSLLASLTACSTTDLNSGVIQDETTISSTKAGAKKWTVFVHLAADNNLYPFGLKDMAEMAYGFNSKDTNIVVLFDGEKTGDSAIYEITNSTKKPVTGAPITSKKLTTPVFSGNEVDSGDPKLMAKFLDWGTKTYPAEHTAVVVWNHGSGIFRNGKLLKPKNSKAGDITSQGFAWDDNGGNMDIKDLDAIMAPAVANLGKKVDVLDFDACLMAHVEAAYQIKNNTNYLVGSEKTEAGDGNDYIGIAQALSKNPNMSGLDFAKMMVDTFAKSYKPGGNQYSGRPEEFTLSAADTSAVANGLTPALMDLATDLAKNPSLARDARENTTTYDGDDEARDLGHFLTLLSKDPAAASLKAKADKANEELKKAVVREAHADGTRDINDSTGLVLYFPAPGDTFRARYNPSEIRFAENAPWVDFLKKFIALK